MLSDFEPGIEMMDASNSNKGGDLPPVSNLQICNNIGKCGARSRSRACSTDDIENGSYLRGCFEAHTHNPSSNNEIDSRRPSHYGIGADAPYTCSTDDTETGSCFRLGREALLSKSRNNEIDFASPPYCGISAEVHNTCAYDTDDYETGSYFRGGYEVHNHNTSSTNDNETSYAYSRCGTSAINPLQCATSYETEMVDYFSGDGVGNSLSPIGNNDIETGRCHPGHALAYSGQEESAGNAHLWAKKMKVRMSTAHLDQMEVALTRKNEIASRRRPQQRKSHMFTFVLFITSSMVFAMGFLVSTLFSDPNLRELYLSIMWCPNGLCMIWMLVWGRNWEHAGAILAAYVSGISFSIIAVYGFTTTRFQITSILCDLVQILLGSTGLLIWCKNELMVMNAKSILTFRVYFSFVLLAAIFTPLIQSVIFTAVSYSINGEQLMSSKPKDVLIMWSLASSIGTIAILWVGIILLATLRSFMFDHCGYSRYKRADVRNVFRSIVNALKMMILANSTELLWKGSLLVVLAIGLFIFNFFAILEICQLDNRMGLLFMPGIVFVAWTYPPIVSAFFQLYCIVAMSSLQLSLELRCQNRYVLANLARLFMDQLVLIVTSFFIIVSTSSSRIEHGMNERTEVSAFHMPD